MDKHIFQDLCALKEGLQEYHGATKLQNIPEIAACALHQTLTAHIKISLDQTVSQVLQKINDVLSMESIIFQFGTFQEQTRNKSILPSQRLPGNQRLVFYTSKNLHEWLQIAFSPQEYYFTINPSRFRKGDKQYNRKIFQNAVDTVVINPEDVPESSLETLGISLDPDCQNLKDIFNKMYPLTYQDADQQKHTVRIYEYQGKYITFVGSRIVFPVNPSNATIGEQKKEDVKMQIGVYPDLFSLIRREEYIIAGTQEKASDYQDIKKKLLLSIKEIEWNKKEYSIRVQQNVQEIIDEIAAATSAKIVADKLYHLYKITGQHSERDKKLLEASMTNFTKRIAQLIGISSHSQLHLLELKDTLDDQNLNLELFYSQVAMFLREPHVRYSKFLLAFENYYAAQKGSLKEPFRTFDRQIHQCFGDLAGLRTKDPRSVMSKVAVILALQKKFRESYTREHAYKRGEMTAQQLQEKLMETDSDELVQRDFPGIYTAIFAEIAKKRAEFSPTFTKTQLNRFFDALNDLEILQSTVDVLDGMFT